MSTRKIAGYLKDLHGLSISHSTISRAIKNKDSHIQKLKAWAKEGDDAEVTEVLSDLNS